jgi:phosphatidylglycerol---prolipoprotein diacylglyceryl transferase
LKPIPIQFHIGPLQIHTYGIGLAITFWWAYRYFGRRLRSHGYDTGWLARAFAWIIAASVVGARAVSVIANLGYYSRNPGDIFAVWHGGLSSFGGLLLGVPTGLYLAHRWSKDLRLSVAADIVAPVLAFAWAIGRLLGPQLMYSGGGNQTRAWYGMAYAGQSGNRVPVPIFQSLECFVVWGIALLVERQVAKRGGPVGVVATATVTFYGAARYFDEHVLLPHGPGGVAVEAASLAFVAVGLGFMGLLLWRWRRTQQSESSSDSDATALGLGVTMIVTDPWAPRADPLATVADTATGKPPSSQESSATARDDESTSTNDASREADVPMIRAGNDTTT